MEAPNKNAKITLKPEEIQIKKAKQTLKPEETQIKKAEQEIKRKPKLNLLEL